MKNFLLAVLIVALAIPSVLYLISPLEPKVWRPDPISSLTGELAPNNALDNMTLLAPGKLLIPEDVVVSNEGEVYTGLRDGRIVRIKPSAPEQVEEFANTGGRPLGLRFANDGALIVADSIKGLLRIDKHGQISTLVDTIDGDTLKLVDHLAVAANGDVYFSVASQRFASHEYVLDFVEASASGRVYKYSASTGQTHLLMDNLFFSNGIALSQEEDFLLIVESGRARVLKHHLQGDKKGFTEVFIDALPGIPSNISIAHNGTVWLPIVYLRDWKIEKLAAFPTIRKMIGGLPSAMMLPERPYGMVLGIDSTGNITHNLQTPSYFTGISSVVEHDGVLYLGSIREQAIGVYRLPMIFPELDFFP